MFARNPHDIYFDIYFMVKVLGFTAEYVETISPSERGVFKMYHEREKSIKQLGNSETELNNIGLSVGDFV